MYFFFKKYTFLDNNFGKKKSRSHHQHLIINADSTGRARPNVAALTEAVRADFRIEIPLAVVGTLGVIEAGRSDGAVRTGQANLGDDLEGDILRIRRERHCQRRPRSDLLLKRAQLVPCTPGELLEASSALRRLPIIVQQMSWKTSILRDTWIAAVHTDQCMAVSEPISYRAIEGDCGTGRGSAGRDVHGVALGKGFDAVEDGGGDVRPDGGAVGEPFLGEGEVGGGDGPWVHLREARNGGTARCAAWHVAEGSTSDDADTIRVNVANRTAHTTRGRARVRCTSCKQCCHSCDAKGGHFCVL